MKPDPISRDVYLEDLNKIIEVDIQEVLNFELYYNYTDVFPKNCT